MSEARLSLRHLNKSFGKRKVIDDVSFDMFGGEILGFLGPNGAGKTTTIKMIMGFLREDSGQILINGIDLRKSYEQAMSHVGGIVENPEMYPYLSGRKNLELYARVQGGITQSRIDEVVALVGMQQRIRDKYKKYSLGMKQRVGLAQAMLHRPNVLILDEPTNGLDPAGIRELRDILKHLAHDKGVAVLVSSHQLAEMQLMCDRVAIIQNGRIIGIRPIAELLSQKAGSRYRVTTDNARNALAALTADVTLPEALRASARGVDQQALEVAAEPGQIPAVTRALVLAGVNVSTVEKVAHSLEDAFIEATGGSEPIA